MRRRLTATVGWLVVCTSIAVVLVPVGVAGAAPRNATFNAASVPTAVRPDAVKNTDITSSGYKPSSLTAEYYGSTEKRCTAKRLGITITNRTSKEQVVMFEGKTFEKIPSGDEGGACFYGTAKHKFVFTLKKSKSKLTVTVS